MSDELLGFIMVYSWIHFFVISWHKTYPKRTKYEKVVTWVALVSFVLFVIGATMILN